MKNQLTFLAGLVLLVVLLAYMFTFQVRYDQVAVLTTFKKAVEPLRNPKTGELVRNADGSIKDPGSVIFTPGLRFRLPWPIQQVTVYSKKLHVLEDQLEELQTNDNNSVIVRTYVAWRIDDPYAFFRTLGNTKAAEQTLGNLMRNFSGVIGRYNLSDMVNLDPKKLKLNEIEQACKDQIQKKLADIRPSYGIQVEEVGIRKIVLAEDTTKKVFARMRATRERIAENIRAEGDSHAATIKKEAESMQKQILAFAQARAQAIRAEGDREAESYYKQFHADEDFAIFLRQIEALKKMLAHNTTFVLDANKLGMLDLFKQSPAQSPQSAMDDATPFSREAKRSATPVAPAR